MAEISLAIVIFVFIIAITALVFGGWVIVSVFRGAGRFLGWMMGRPSSRAVNRFPMPAPQMMPQPAPVFENRGPVAFNPAPASPPSAEPVGSSSQACSFPRCKAPNSVEARFCRRCGRQLQKPASVVRERMAV